MGIADTVLWNNTNRKGTTQKKHTHTQTEIHPYIEIHFESFESKHTHTHTHTLNNLLKLNLYIMLFGL